MKTFIGVWLDYQSAKIVKLGEDGNLQGEMATISSDVRSQHKGSGGATGHKHIEDHRANDIEKFFAKLDQIVQHAHGLCVLGSGRAKTDYARHLSNHTFKDLGSVEVLPAEHMTDHQLVAAVKEFFGHKPLRKS
jgi:hypothetical protein